MAVAPRSRTPSDPGFLDFLAVPWKFIPGLSAAAKKIFQIFENYVCICGKMGYNRVE